MFSYSSHTNSSLTASLLALLALLLLTTPTLMAGPMVDLTNKEWKLTLGREYPGAKGTLTRNDKGHWILKSDFSGGGNYTGMVYSPKWATDYKALKMELQTNAKHIIIHLRDSKGQNFCVVYPLPNTGDLNYRHKIYLREFYNAKDHSGRYVTWGGPKDRIIRPPFTSLIIRASSYGKNVKSPTIILQSIKAELGAFTGKAVSVSNPTDLFVAPGTPDITLQVHRDLTVSDIAFECRDCTGNTVLSGKATVRNHQISLPLPQTVGFYEYAFPDYTETSPVGVVVQHRFQGPQDPFFCTDLACSCMPALKNLKTLKAYFDIMKYGGISMIRERLYWCDINPAYGTYDWNADLTDTLRKTEAENGIKVLELFHTAPNYLGRQRDRSKPNFSPYPRKLALGVKSWEDMIDRWGHGWHAIEAWNEPEYAGLPGDQQGSIQRMLSYVIRKKGLNIPVVGGVLVGNSFDAPMLRLFVENGMLDDGDAFSFHSYHPAVALEQKIANYRYHFRNSAKPGIPIWISESGWAWKRGTPRATMEQDLESAAQITMKAIEAKACGVARYFTFIMQYYDEGIRNFGMMDRYHTPMRSIAAYYHAARRLAHADYIGDLKEADGARRARIFRKDDQAIIVFFSENNVKLPKGLTIQRLEGMDGRRLPNGATIAAPEKLTYAFTTVQAVQPYLNSKTQAMKLLDIARKHRPTPRKARPVVFQFRIDYNTTQSIMNGYLFKNQARVNLPMSAHNLSDTSLTIRPKLLLPAGAKILQDAPETLTIPPRSTGQFSLLADMSNAFDSTDFPRLRLVDEAKHAEPIVIGLKNWNFKNYDVKSGLDSAPMPETMNQLSQGWIRLEGLNCWKQWDGAIRPNIRGAFHLSYSPETLRLKVIVEDNTHYQPFGISWAWQGDSLQIGIKETTGQHVSSKNYLEFTAANTEDGPQIYQHIAENKADESRILKTSRITFRRTGKTSTYVIDFNAEELRLKPFQPGQKYRLGFIVNSSNGTVRDGYLHWGEGIAATKDPKEFNGITLLH